MPSVKRTDSKGRILKDGESQRKDGTYRYRYTDADGVRRDVYSSRLVPSDRTSPGKKEDLSLREKEKVILRDLADGIKASVENKATLNDLFELYMNNKPELKESTRRSYIYLYQQYVHDDLGQRKISSIKYSDIKAFYNRLILKTGLKPSSTDVIHTLIHPVFTMAVRDNYIRVNPASGVMADIKKNLGWDHSKRHALTAEEQAAFMQFITSTKKYNYWIPLYTFLLGTGCRIGEAGGLIWEDCDFENGLIHIRRTLTYQKFEGDTKCHFHILTPKTAKGERVIPMLSEVRIALEAAHQQYITRPIAYEVEGYTGFVFQGKSGRLITSSDVNRTIDRICHKYNSVEIAKAQAEDRTALLLPHFSAHTLRHTFCTRLCENESNVKIIQEIMGHASYSTTMDIYTDVTTQQKVKSFENLEGKIKIK